MAAEEAKRRMPEEARWRPEEAKKLKSQVRGYLRQLSRNLELLKAATAALIKSAAQLHASETGQTSLDELLTEYMDVLSNTADGLSRVPVWLSPEEPREEEEESGSCPTAHLRSAHAIDVAEAQSVGLYLNQFTEKAKGDKNYVKVTKAFQEGKRPKDLPQNHPRVDDFSPAQMLFGQRLKTALPVLPAAYEPIDTRRAEVTRQAERDRNKESKREEPPPFDISGIGPGPERQDGSVESHQEIVLRSSTLQRGPPQVNQRTAGSPSSCERFGSEQSPPGLDPQEDTVQLIACPRVGQR